MKRWIPCRRRDFVRRLSLLGFDGPFSGTRHSYMVFQQRRLAIPSNAEYSVPQLREMLREAGRILTRRISPEEWDRF